MSASKKRWWLPRRRRDMEEIRGQLKVYGKIVEDPTKPRMVHFHQEIGGAVACEKNFTAGGICTGPRREKFYITTGELVPVRVHSSNLNTRSGNCIEISHLEHCSAGTQYALIAINNRTFLQLTRCDRVPIILSYARYSSTDRSCWPNRELYVEKANGKLVKGIVLKKCDGPHDPEHMTVMFEGPVGKQERGAWVYEYPEGYFAHLQMHPSDWFPSINTPYGILIFAGTISSAWPETVPPQVAVVESARTLFKNISNTDWYGVSQQLPESSHEAEVPGYSGGNSSNQGNADTSGHSQYESDARLRDSSQHRVFTQSRDLSPTLILNQLGDPTWSENLTQFEDLSQLQAFNKFGDNGLIDSPSDIPHTSGFHNGEIPRSWWEASPDLVPPEGERTPKHIASEDSNQELTPETVPTDQPTP
ncbi:hypothetical protein F5Y19DRAFT_484845 [Xylariaceae sp. FL1651]|nr:hypothetical protein F5Y19DRAFT_484845 [Xylariaceae sp. FL1651]